jgi:hypothetical protein
MRRKTAFTRGRVLSVVVATFAGYVVGGWNGTVPHPAGLSAAQAVALRFPQELEEASPVTALLATKAKAAALDLSHVAQSVAQAALFSPQPMVPQALASQASTQQASAVPPPAAQAPLKLASADPTAPLPQPAPAVKRSGEPKPVAANLRGHNDRPGFVLNDAQIASIKERLHLTPDQEEMWPAVEAALRNIAYTRALDAKRHNANAQVAAADVNSVDVRELKSAAIPLIMSFSSEQKDEVRNLAHVMGLDQLASQF